MQYLLMSAVVLTAGFEILSTGLLVMFINALRIVQMFVFYYIITVYYLNKQLYI